MKNKKDIFENSVFKNTDDYIEFCKKHGVFGTEAIKLKKEMQRSIIPLPIVKRIYKK